MKSQSFCIASARAASRVLPAVCRAHRESRPSAREVESSRCTHFQRKELERSADERCRSSFFGKGNRSAAADFVDRDEDGGASRQAHFPTRPVDREKAEQELSLNIKKAMSLEEAAPKQKHVRSPFPRSAPLFPAHSRARRAHRLYLGLPQLCLHLERSPDPAHPLRRGADLQSVDHRAQTTPGGPPYRISLLPLSHIPSDSSHTRQCIKEAQNQTGWLETCARTIGGDVSRGEYCLSFLVRILTASVGYGSLIRAYVTLINAKLRFHQVHPDFNGLFEYEEYISLRGVDDPNEG